MRWSNQKSHCKNVCCNAVNVKQGGDFTMIKKLAGCIGQYKQDAILTPVFVALEIAMDIIIPLLMARMIDDGITNCNMNVILKIGLILIFICTFSLASGFLSGHFAARASAGFAKNLRKTMYYKIQEFTFGNIDKFSSSGLVTRLTTDVTNVQYTFQIIIRIFVRAPLMIIFAVFMVFSINRKLAWVFAVIFPVLAIGLIIIMAKAHPKLAQVFKLYDKLNNLVQENIRGIRVVKSYVREDFETEKFKDSPKWHGCTNGRTYGACYRPPPLYCTKLKGNLGIR